MHRLRDKVIVISGGTKGVGRAFAEVAGNEGAKVVIGGRDEKAAKDTLRNIRTAGSEGIFVPCDLLKVQNCRRLFSEAYTTFGSVDGFFSYAGVTPVSPLDTCDEDTFDWVMAVNFKATFFCCQEAVKYMRIRRGGG